MHSRSSMALSSKSISGKVRRGISLALSLSLTRGKSPIFKSVPTFSTNSGRSQVQLIHESEEMYRAILRCDAIQSPVRNYRFSVSQNLLPIAFYLSVKQQTCHIVPLSITAHRCNTHAYKHHVRAKRRKKKIKQKNL